VPFVVREQRGDGIAVIAPDGELDVSTAVQVEERVAAALGSITALLLDLRCISFIDSSGLRAVLVAAGRCREAGTELTVVSSEAVDRVIRLAQLGSGLPLRQIDEVSPEFKRLADDTSPGAV